MTCAATTEDQQFTCANARVRSGPGGAAVTCEERGGAAGGNSRYTCYDLVASPPSGVSASDAAWANIDLDCAPCEAGASYTGFGTALEQYSCCRVLDRAALDAIDAANDGGGSSTDRRALQEDEEEEERAESGKFTRCTQCDAGSYNAAGAEECGPCAAGFADTDGNPATECAACVAGEYAALGAQSCTACSAVTPRPTHEHAPRDPGWVDHDNDPRYVMS